MDHPVTNHGRSTGTLARPRHVASLAFCALVPLTAVPPLPLNAGEKIFPAQNSRPHKKAPSKNTPPNPKQAEEPDVPPDQTRDPLQKLNRATFGFNHVLYRYVLSPVGKVTEFALTKHGVRCLENALQNVEAPVRIVGCLFQAKFKRAGQETGKLLVNSTVGVGGLFKVSDRIEGLKDVPQEDFGQAVASWGVPRGPYIVLPVIGPSTAREIIGHVGDTASNPATWLGSNTVRLMTRGIKTGIENPFRMDLYDAVTASAVDPYVAAREGYISRRSHEIAR